MAHTFTRDERPAFPKRAVVTAGMPYGNKGLHFGHVGGVFVPADFYARFLRDRLGKENVLFVSGTDCYGSPIMEGYRKLVEKGEFEGSIVDYVESNHNRQNTTMENYDISLDIFRGSALEPAASVHNEMTAEIIKRLDERGFIIKRSTKQFYDPEAKTFLNGRQVLGRCPIQGCKSDKAYADECDLGHQFEPEELIAPKSALTGCTPELVPVDNLYFDLPAFVEYLKEYTESRVDDPTVRSVVTSTMREWLLAPSMYIQNKLREDFDAIVADLPAHTVHEPEGNKSSFTVEFNNWEDRDVARDILTEKGVRFRSGKALVPLRITGNIEWGVPVPTIQDVADLTCWVWPESLWAPMSFTKTVLENADEGRYSTRNWLDFWGSKDARAYQFIGQDNIYFYCIAQSALWEALGWDLEQSTVVANYHLLYMGKKASSSSQTPPPPADELLDHYTAEQLRSHWLSLGLGEKPVSFSPKVYDTRETGKNEDGTPLLACDDKRVIDPALKEGALLTGIFNRLARSCFYSVSKLDNLIPATEPAYEVMQDCEQTLLAFEQAMYRFEFHKAEAIADEFIRRGNKLWSFESKNAKAVEDTDELKCAIANAFQYLRVATILMHGIVPEGCETIASYFKIDADEFFNFDNAFLSTNELLRKLGKAAGTHQIEPLPQRFDFFRKHDSQY